MRGGREKILSLAGIAAAIVVGIVFAETLMHTLQSAPLSNPRAVLKAAESSNPGQEAKVSGPSKPPQTSIAALQLASTAPSPTVATTATQRVPTPTTLPSSTLAATSPPPVPTPTMPSPTVAATPAQPLSTTVPSPTLAPSPLPSIATRLDWPDFLPEGMAFAAEDSWPFRFVAPSRQDERFLIFRKGQAWLVIRSRPKGPPIIPRSAAAKVLTIRNTSATLVKYLSGDFTLLLQRPSRSVQLSGGGLSDQEIIRIAESLRPLTDEDLRRRLVQEAAHQPLHLTLLWPSDLPTGVRLVPTETQIRMPASPSEAYPDGYIVTFRGTNSRIQIGGGTVEPPRLAGAQEQITDGTLTGSLTTAPGRFVLIIDGGAASGGPVPRFPPSGSPGRLPLVQQGRIFVAAENIARAQFDQVIANLQPLLPQIFQAQSSGQNLLGIDYRWPAKLPAGYTIDLASTKVSFDDFVLQGGLPFFELTATGPNGKVTIRGGHESSGATITVPEGADVQRSTPNIHGNLASAAQTPDGSDVVWSEDGVVYAITSPSVPMDQLITIAEGLQPLDADEFLRRAQ